MFWRLNCALLLVSVSWAQNTPLEPHATGFRVSGTVVHALTGQPLPAVQVSIIRAQTPDVLQVVNADEGGHFVFPMLAPGKYVLVAQSPGFPRQSWDEHAGFSTAAVVGPRKDSENIIFRLQPEASISGTVTDEANEPVRDAQVMLFHRATEEGNSLVHLREQVVTDDHGHYHFAHLFNGKFFVAVSGRPWYAQPSDESQSKQKDPLDVAYPVTYYAGTTDESGATAIAVSPGEKITADVSLAPVPTLRLEVIGIVNPGEGTQVYALQKVFGEVSIGAVSQTVNPGTGRTVIGGLPPGEVEIHGMPGNTKEVVKLTASRTLKADSQSPPVSLAGKVILGDTNFRLAQVNLVDRSTGENNTALIKPDGSFQFTDLPAKGGTFQIAVYNVPGAILANMVASGAKVDGRTIEVAPGAAVTLTLLMSRGFGVIDGTALRNGKPAPGAMIVLIPRDLANNQSRVRRDQSDSDGTFTLPQIPPGSYTLLAIQKGWELEWQNPAVLEPYLKLGQRVLVGPNHRYETEINVQ